MAEERTTAATETAADAPIAVDLKLAAGYEIKKLNALGRTEAEIAGFVQKVIGDALDIEAQGDPLRKLANAAVKPHLDIVLANLIHQLATS